MVLEKSLNILSNLSAHISTSSVMCLQYRKEIFFESKINTKNPFKSLFRALTTIKSKTFWPLIFQTFVVGVAFGFFCWIVSQPQPLNSKIFFSNQSRLLHSKIHFFSFKEISFSVRARRGAFGGIVKLKGEFYNYNTTIFYKKKNTIIH